MPAAISCDERRRRQLVAVADQHQRRAFDRRQQRPRIGPRHDRLLLAHEGLGPVSSAMVRTTPLQRRVALPVAVDEERPQQRRYLGEPAGLGERDLRLAPLASAPAYRARAGIEQGEPAHPLGRLPQIASAM